MRLRVAQFLANLWQEPLHGHPCMVNRSREDRGSPPGRSFMRAEDLVLAIPGRLDRPAASARHRGRDHDQDRRNDDADDPPDPVDAARRLNTQRCGEVVADEHAADPADNRKPERNVVAVPRREELAQQADDDACDDHTDDVHRRPFHPLERPCSAALPEYPSGRGLNLAWQPWQAGLSVDGIEAFTVWVRSRGAARRGRPAGTGLSRTRSSAATGTGRRPAW